MLGEVPSEDNNFLNKVLNGWLGIENKLIFRRIIGYPHVPPSLLLAMIMSAHHLLKLIKDLFIEGTTEKDHAKLEHYVMPMDVPLIKLIRPSIAGIQDRITWLHTANGEYTVKSGYNLLRTMKGQSSSPSLNFYKSIWKHHIPSKIQHFWWRVLHDSLPVAVKLKQKRVLKSSICQVCGDDEETINHLLFACRVSREIRELAPIHMSLVEDSKSHKASENYSSCMELNRYSQKNLVLSHFLGWSL